MQGDFGLFRRFSKKFCSSGKKGGGRQARRKQSLNSSQKAVIIFG